MIYKAMCFGKFPFPVPAGRVNPLNSLVLTVAWWEAETNY